MLDLCAEGSGEEVVGWLTAAVQRRPTTPNALVERLDARGRVHNRRLIQEVLTDARDGVHSVLERHYLVDVERMHRLPTAHRQFRVPGTRHIADAAYIQSRTLIELDGDRWHHSRGEADRWRDNSHAPSWSTLRFGWADCTVLACTTARSVAAVLAARGWVGHLQRCVRCS